LLPLLVESALRALAAAVLVWAALRLLRVRNVRAQKAAWTLVLLGAIAMPLLMRPQWLPAADIVTLPKLATWVSGAVHPVTPISAASSAEATPAPPPDAWSDALPTSPITALHDAAGNPASGRSTAADLPDALIAPVVSASQPATAALPSASAATQSALRPLEFAWFIYLAIAAVLLLRLIAGLASALRLWMAADPVPAPSLAGLAPAGSVRVSTRLASPINFGPGIVLPPDYPHWSAEKLRAVLAHERAHVRQGDFYLQLLAGVYSALVWFSPLGWFLKHKLSELGEAMGDRAGLQEAASPSSYAQMLLEFAALPRPNQTGVAMARPGKLASRIERLLNDTTFHQCFASRHWRRAALVLVIVPAALLASAALVRVQAAQQTADSPQALIAKQSPDPAPQTGVSNPPQTVTGQEPQAPAPPAATPNPAPEPDAETAPAAAPEPGAEPVPGLPAAPGQIGAPPVPPIHVLVPPVPPVHVNIPPIPNIDAQVTKAQLEAMDSMREGLDRNHAFYDGGEPWALVPAQGETKAPLSGHLNGPDRAAIDNARKTAHAPFFWFKHDGKAYIVEDPAVIAQVQSLEKPIDELRSQMRAIGKQQRDLGHQLRQQMSQQRQAPIPKPDLSKQMAELNAAVDSLKASQTDTITREQLRNLQRQIGELQAQLFRAESGFYKENGQWGAEMGEFGKQMGKLGAEQGHLAGEMARMSIDNRGKIDAIINESLRDGKAKPVN
jgi:hypothetical protein